MSNDRSNVKKKLAYEDLSSAAKFREQLRLTFAGVIVATAFVIPMLDPVTIFLKLTLGFSASLAALFLIMSAARIKYAEPGTIYETFYISERFRMRMFDWSVDFFGFSALIFIGLLLAGITEKLLSIKLDGLWGWIVTIVFACIAGAVVIITRQCLVKRKFSKKLPEI